MGARVFNEAKKLSGATGARREVSDARIWGGIHFRAATQAGEAMGQRIASWRRSGC